MNKALGINVQPKFWLIILTLICMAMLVTVFSGNAALAGQLRQIEQLEQQKNEIRAQNEVLKVQADFSRTDAYIEREARARGMVKENDTRYVLSPEGN